LKIVLKHVTERVNFIRPWLVFSNFFSKINRFIFNVNQCFIPNSNFATVAFLNFGVDWAKRLLRCRRAHLKLLYLFRILYLCGAGFSSKNIKRNSDLD